MHAGILGAVLKYEVIRENRMISLQFDYMTVGVSSFKENAVCCLAARCAAFTDVSPSNRRKIYVYMPVLI
jgi:hypothetical protein